MLAELPENIRSLIVGHIRNRNSSDQNLLISGEAPLGKNSLLHDLIAQIPEDERAVIITDEQILEAPASPAHTVYLEVSQQNPRWDLARRSWRMRPDWIIQNGLDNETAENHLNSARVGHNTIAAVDATDPTAGLIRFMELVTMGTASPPSFFKTVLNSTGYLILNVAQDPKTGAPYINEIAQWNPKTEPALKTLYQV